MTCGDCRYFARWQKDWDERILPVQLRWLGVCNWHIEKPGRWENDSCGHCTPRPNKAAAASLQGRLALDGAEREERTK